MDSNPRAPHELPLADDLAFNERRLVNLQNEVARLENPNYAVMVGAMARRIRQDLEDVMANVARLRNMSVEDFRHMRGIEPTPVPAPIAPTTPTPALTRSRAPKAVPAVLPEPKPETHAEPAPAAAPIVSRAVAVPTTLPKPTAATAPSPAPIGLARSAPTPAVAPTPAGIVVHVPELYPVSPSIIQSETPADLDTLAAKYAESLTYAEESADAARIRIRTKFEEEILALSEQAKAIGSGKPGTSTGNQQNGHRREVDAQIAELRKELKQMNDTPRFLQEHAEFVRSQRAIIKDIEARLTAANVDLQDLRARGMTLRPPKAEPAPEPEPIDAVPPAPAHEPAIAPVPAIPSAPIATPTPAPEVPKSIYPKLRALEEESEKLGGTQDWKLEQSIQRLRDFVLRLESLNAATRDEAIASILKNCRARLISCERAAEGSNRRNGITFLQRDIAELESGDARRIDKALANERAFLSEQLGVPVEPSSTPVPAQTAEDTPEIPPSIYPKLRALEVGLEQLRGTKKREQERSIRRLRDLVAYFESLGTATRDEAIASILKNCRARLDYCERAAVGSASRNGVKYLQRDIADLESGDARRIDKVLANERAFISGKLGVPIGSVPELTNEAIDEIVSQIEPTEPMSEYPNLRALEERMAAQGGVKDTKVERELQRLRLFRDRLAVFSGASRDEVIASVLKNRRERVAICESMPENDVAHNDIVHLQREIASLESGDASVVDRTLEEERAYLLKQLGTPRAPDAPELESNDRTLDRDVELLGGSDPILLGKLTAALAAPNRRGMQLLHDILSVLEENVQHLHLVLQTPRFRNPGKHRRLVAQLELVEEVRGVIARYRAALDAQEPTPARTILRPFLKGLRERLGMLEATDAPAPDKTPLAHEEFVAQLRTFVLRDDGTPSEILDDVMHRCAARVRSFNAQYGEALPENVRAEYDVLKSTVLKIASRRNNLERLASLLEVMRAHYRANETEQTGEIDEEIPELDIDELMKSYVEIPLEQNFLDDARALLDELKAQEGGRAVLHQRLTEGKIVESTDPFARFFFTIAEGGDDVRMKWETFDQYLDVECTTLESFQTLSDLLFFCYGDAPWPTLDDAERERVTNAKAKITEKMEDILWKEHHAEKDAEPD